MATNALQEPQPATDGQHRLKAAADQPRQATLYRMVMDEHVCPYGLKAKDLLRRQGYTVEDKWLTSREATEAFKAEHGVQTTPQTFINGERIGGYDRPRPHFGETGARSKGHHPQ